MDIIKKIGQGILYFIGGSIVGAFILAIGESILTSISLINLFWLAMVLVLGILDVYIYLTHGEEIITMILEKVGLDV